MEHSPRRERHLPRAVLQKNCKTAQHQQLNIESAETGAQRYRDAKMQTQPNSKANRIYQAQPDTGK